MSWLHEDYSNGAEVDPDEDYGYSDFIDNVDVIIMGRKSFEKVLSFGEWHYGNMPVVVMSRKGVTIPDELPDSVRVSKLDPESLLDELADQGLNHAWVDGGMTIQGFLKAGLVTDIIVTTIPRLIGDGPSLFGHLHSDFMLMHKGTKTYPSGLVQSRYQVASAHH